MQENLRSIYNNDHQYPWERIEQEAERKHMSLARFTLFCYKHYFKDKQRNRFKLNIVQVILGINLVLTVIIIVMLI